jgi:hypothetical protein
MPTSPDKGSSSPDPVIDPAKKTWQEAPADSPPADSAPADSAPADSAPADSAPAAEPPAEPAGGTVSPDKKTWQ